MIKHNEEGQPLSWPRLARPAQRDSAWAAEEYRFGAFVLRTDRRELRCDDIVRPMERRCFDLLTYLLRHAGRVVSKEELLDHVWVNRFVTMSVIAQSVLKVRKALQLPDGQEGPLRTVHRVGYRIVGDVVHRRLTSAELQSPSAAAAWSWEEPRLRNMPDAPDWLPPALGAFGAWALHSHGIAVQSSPLPAGALGSPEARCEVAPDPQGFEATVDLHLDATTSVKLRALSASPFQAVWQAAESAAWLVRLQEMFDQGPPDVDELRWERLASLSHAQPAALGTEEPLLSQVWGHQLASSRLDQQADLIMEAAWRCDPGAGKLAERLRSSAVQAGDGYAQGWSELALAMSQWQRGTSYGMVEHVNAGVSLVARGGHGVHAQRAAAVAGHLLCAATPHFETPAWWRALVALDVPPSSSARRWWLLANLQQRLSRADGADLTGVERLDAAVLSSTATDGLQALLLNQCGLLRVEDGDLDVAWQRMTASSEIALRCAWSSVRALCLLSLGDLCARLGDRVTLDRCIGVLETGREREAPRSAAVRDWLIGRRLRLEGHHHAALGLIEQSWPVLQRCGLWFREDAWLAAIDSALQVRSRQTLAHWREVLGAPDTPRGRARSATLSAIDASIALLDGERLRARQLMVQAWRGAPTSTAKRLLAMASASALRWTPTDSPELFNQALNQAGPWLHQSSAGRLLREAASHRIAVSSLAPAAVAEGGADADSLWLWAA